MVKNTKGGKGAKSLARKNSAPAFVNTERLRLATDELEKYACVTKHFGNGMCEITLNDNTKLVGHIRGAFRGRQKHRNMITVNSIVLIGLREWEELRKNCDLLYIYDDIQVEQLRTMPQIDIANLIQMKTVFGGTVSEGSEVRFTTETEEEVADMLETVDEFVIDDNQEIDFDDI
jgi:translation initiation factor IF-1